LLTLQVEVRNIPTGFLIAFFSRQKALWAFSLNKVIKVSNFLLIKEKNLGVILKKAFKRTKFIGLTPKAC
jgi:hypothetical protein